MQHFLVVLLIVAGSFVAIICGLGPIINDAISRPRRRR